MRAATIGTMIFIAALSLQAQTIDFAAQVSFEYNGESLEEVLDDLSNRYGIKFSYSRNMIPMDQEMYVTVSDEEFSNALNLLFEKTPIIYGFIGNQLVLSVDPVRQKELIGAMFLGDNPVASIDDAPVFEMRHVQYVSLINARSTGFDMSVDPLSSGIMSKAYITYESDRLMREAEEDENAFRAQITLFPPIQAISRPYSYAPVNLSFNVLWGVSDNIEGFELGGLVNVVRGDVEGLQIAGLVNDVKQNFEGFQLAGIANSVKEESFGLQVAGITNLAPEGGDLVQVGGVMSLAGSRVYTQVSGIGNYAPEVKTVQLAGLFNVASKSHVQVAGLVNVARNTGVQIGLINIADTSRVSIGLLSFVKTGYQSIEIGGEEMLHANLNFRLGTRSFYNILHVSATYDFTSWAIGYGIGTSVRTGRRNFVQFELMGRQVSENESWTEELNLLNQLNVIWDLQVGSQMSLVIGPTFNLSVSRRYNEDTGLYGTDLAPYTIFDETFANDNGPVNLKAWIGFHVGLRFNSPDRQVYYPYTY